MGSIAFVGMDVHKATIAVAVAEGARGGEVRQLGIFPNRAEVIAKLAGRLAGDGRELSFCYEAGPCGYGLQRQLEGLGHACVVVAPSPGHRVCRWPIRRSVKYACSAGASAVIAGLRTACAAVGRPVPSAPETRTGTSRCRRG